MNSREQFEAAWRKEYPMHGTTVFKRSGLNHDAYVNTRVQDGWLMWQAAKSAVVLDDGRATDKCFAADGKTATHVVHDLGVVVLAKDFNALWQATQPAQTFEQWAADPVRTDKIPLAKHANGAYRDTRAYLISYGWKSALKYGVAQPAQTRALTADDADMVWPDYDTETFHHSIDEAVEYEVDQSRPILGDLELKVQLAKRIPTATIRIFNIHENGHEWEIVTAAQPAPGGDRE